MSAKNGFPNVGRVENSGFPRRKFFFFSSLDFQRSFKRPGPGGGVFSNIPRQDALLPEIQPDCLEELDSECLEDPLVMLKCAD